MGKAIDINEQFNLWYSPIESKFTVASIDSSPDELLPWLKQAYLAGFRTAAQDSVDTLHDYATALAGVPAVTITREAMYDDAAHNLMVYFTKVLQKVEDDEDETLQSF